jgi:flagellar hook-associated protein 1 FlgK
MATGDVFGVGTSALLAFQRGLATTSHNIANVNTEGYHRQRTEFDTRVPLPSGNGYIGTGVDVTSVTRIFDQFLNTQVVTNTALTSQHSTYFNFASQVDNLLGDSATGLSSAMQGLFSSLHELADDPTSMAVRQVVLSEAESLVDRFHNLDDRLGVIESGINTLIRNEVAEINGIADNIAQLNGEIIALSGLSSQPPNDLLDQRDQLVAELAEKVSVNTVLQDNGTMSVFIGNGQNLVVGTNASTLSTQPSDFDASELEIVFSNRSDSIVITNAIQGGSLGGALAVRTEVIDPARNGLGLMAVAVADLLNSQNNAGLDLNGQFGDDIFSTLQVTVETSGNNSGVGVIGVDYGNIGGLVPSDYMLTYEGGDKYRLLRLSDNTNTIIDATLPIPEIDGLQINIAPGAAVGDQFLLRPFRQAPDQMEVVMSDPAGLAAAAPVRADASLSNAGNLSVTSLSVADLAAYQAGPTSYTVSTAVATSPTVGGGAGVPTPATLDYTLRINNVAVYESLTDPAPASLADLAALINAETGNTGVRAVVDGAGTGLYLLNDPPSAQPLAINETLLNAGGGTLAAGETVTGFFGGVMTAVGGEAQLNNSAVLTTANSYIVENNGGGLVTDGTYQSGGTISFNGLNLVLNGAPGVGDQVTLQPNAGGAGDNRNALIMAKLQTALTLRGGTADFQSAYGQLVAEVATNTRRAEVNRDAQMSVLTQVTEQRDSMSGVNLDEEAANMLRYQQAYQAAAQIIATGKNVFETLIGVVGR